MATYLPLAGRALFIPALVVAVIYKVAHYQDWTRYDILALLMFQLVIAMVGACFWLGHFSLGFTILLIFATCLTVVYAFWKEL